MASSKFGALVTDMKGKVGGTIFKGTTSGSVVQNRQSKTAGKRSSGKLSKADAGRVISPQNNIAAASQQWRNLTGVQRAAWDTAAPSFPFLNKFGEPYTGSGFQLFMQCNCNTLASTGAFITEPPAPGDVTACPPFTILPISGDPATAKFTGEIPAGYVLQLYATANISAGRKPQKGMYKAIGVYPSGTGMPIAITAAYSAAFGPLSAGMNIWFSGKLSKADAGRNGQNYTVQYSS